MKLEFLPQDIVMLAQSWES